MDLTLLVLDSVTHPQSIQLHCCCLWSAQRRNNVQTTQSKESVPKPEQVIDPVSWMNGCIGHSPSPPGVDAAVNGEEASDAADDGEEASVDCETLWA